MTALEAMLFDAHGVLYDRPLSGEAFVAGLLGEAGYPAVIPAADRPRLRAMKDDASCGRAGFEAYWDAYLTACGVPPSAVARLRRAILEQTHRVVPMPGAPETLRALKGRGLRIGIITDTMYPLAWKMAWLRTAGVADHLDAVACSTEVGAHKPDRRIYRHALDALEVGPREAAFVGHATHELDGARALGIPTVAVNYEPDARADYFIAALPDLLGLPLVPPPVD